MTMVDDFKLLEKHGFELLPAELAENKEEASEIAKKIRYPVAMKVISSEIEHKTDFGGVRLGIKNKEALERAYDDIMDNAGKKKVEGILIQKMARKGVELIIGGRKDAQFGHMVVLGLGGIYVEIFRDISARICPVEESDVEEMINELKSHPLLEGARGKEPINKGVLKELVVRVCRFMKKENISEMDLNPVICDSKGCDLVDVRFR
jgi:acyl-CoA synthetase (NDP forming)